MKVKETFSFSCFGAPVNSWETGWYCVSLQISRKKFWIFLEVPTCWNHSGIQSLISDNKYSLILLSEPAVGILELQTRPFSRLCNWFTTLAHISLTITNGGTWEVNVTIDYSVIQGMESRYAEAQTEVGRHPSSPESADTWGRQNCASLQSPTKTNGRMGLLGEGDKQYPGGPPGCGSEIFPHRAMNQI